MSDEQDIDQAVSSTSAEVEEQNDTDDLDPAKAEGEDDVGDDETK